MDLKSMLNPGRGAVASPASPSASLPPSPALVPTPRLKLPSVRSWASAAQQQSKSSSASSKEKNKSTLSVPTDGHPSPLVATSRSPRTSHLPPSRPRSPEKQPASSHKVYHTTLLYNSLNKTLQAIRNEAGNSESASSESREGARNSPLAFLQTSTFKAIQSLL